MTEIHEDREQQQVAPGEQTSTVATETAAEVNDEQADKKGGWSTTCDAGRGTTKPSSRAGRQIITGTVGRSATMMVDVGYKSEDIPQHNSGCVPRDPHHPGGQDIDAYVMKVEDAEGNVLLRSGVPTTAVWEKLESLKDRVK